MSGHAVYWQTAIEAALTLPPVATEHEHDSWVTRNLAEMLLFVEVFDGPVHLVDDAVRSTSLSHANQRFADRLKGMRLRQGPIPEFYPAGLASGQPATPLNLHELEQVGHFCQVADYLYEKGPKSGLNVRSALHGVGAAACAARNQWRPGFRPDRVVEFVEKPDLSVDLVWRAWTNSPQGIPTMIVLDEGLNPAHLDVWWGIHNGSHLDHLSYSSRHGPAAIEYGHGLLVAESLAMSMEMIAGLESGVAATRLAIWEGLVERAGRLPLPAPTSAHSGPSYAEAHRQTSEEFSPLPTLARAYVVGAIDLIRNRFKHHLIPAEMSIALVDRWTALLRQHNTIPEEMATGYDL